MDGKLTLTEKETPVSYAGREGFIPLLKIHALGHSFVLNAQGYFARFACDAFLAGKLKGFAYSEEKVEEAMAGLSKISSQVEFAIEQPLRILRRR